jgi:hypothetical protein
MTDQELRTIRWKERALHAVSALALTGFFLQGLVAFG